MSPGKVLFLTLCNQNDRIIFKCLPYIGGQLRRKAQPLQRSNYIHRDRFNGRSFFLRESAIPGIHAFLAQRAAFAHQSNTLRSGLHQSAARRWHDNPAQPSCACSIIRTYPLVKRDTKKRNGVISCRIPTINRKIWRIFQT